MINWTKATDAEKCHAIATKLGWTNLVFFNNPYYPRMWVGTPPGEVRTDNGPFDHGTPDYLDDPRAWWPLVEEMVDKHRTLMCSPVPSWMAPGVTGWQCEAGYDKDGSPIYVTAPTPGEAVSIAYLRAKGVEVVT